MHGSIILVKVGISADAILMLKIFDNQNHTRNSMVLCPDLMQIYIRNTTKYGQPDSAKVAVQSVQAVLLPLSNNSSIKDKRAAVLRDCGFFCLNC